MFAFDFIVGSRETARLPSLWKVALAVLSIHCVITDSLAAVCIVANSVGGGSEPNCVCKPGFAAPGAR